MKKLVIGLAISNVVTLLGLTVCATVLAVWSATANERTIADGEAAELRRELGDLREKYLAALGGGNTADRAPRGAANPSAGTTTISSNPLNPPLSGLAAWRLVFVQFNPTDESRCEAHIESRVDMLTPLKRVKIGDTLEGWTVTGIKPDRIRLVDSAGTEGFIQRVADVLEVPANQRQAINTPANPIDLDRLNQAWEREGERITNVPDSATHPPTATPANPAGSSTAGPGTSPDDLVPESGVAGVKTQDYEDGKRIVVPNGGAAPDPNAILKAPDNAVAVTHMLAPELVYELMTNHRRVFAQIVIDGVFNPQTRAFEGAKIVHLPDDSVFALHGFQFGDVILQVNGQRVTTGADIENLAETMDFTEGASILVQRGEAAIVFRFYYSEDAVTEYAKAQIERQKLLENATRSAPHSAGQ